MNVLIRGGGDLASGVALRLHHAGFKVAITELAQPLAVRRAVSFSEAIYEGRWQVEDVIAQRVDSPAEIPVVLKRNEIPVIVDPELSTVEQIECAAVVDARLTKQAVPYRLSPAPLIIGLGPGFTCGENCHAVIETQRGHTLGRVYWIGSALADSGQPEGDASRVLRAPCDGTLRSSARIGDHVEAGDIVADVDNVPIHAPFKGVLRGLIRPGLTVSKGIKVGDLDARDDSSLCFTISEKALAVGGGVLEAILTQKHLTFR
jgi:xanthine dehydrogenase accessory factor